jgi:hypothetical protein
MALKIKIDITVDTELLKARYPKGGNITEHNIIDMVQDKGKFEYPEGNRDKLVSIVSPGSSLKWKIKSKQKGVNLDLLDFVDLDGNMKKVFNSKPGKAGTDDEYDGIIKADTGQKTINTRYAFKFCIKKEPAVTWTWDPDVNVPFPPVVP